MEVVDGRSVQSIGPSLGPNAPSINGEVIVTEQPSEKQAQPVSSVPEQVPEVPSASATAASDFSVSPPSPSSHVESPVVAVDFASVHFSGFFCCFPYPCLVSCTVPRWPLTLLTPVKYR